MSLLDDSLIVWLNRPYFDLGSFHGGLLHVYGIEFSYRKLVEDVPISQNATSINPVTIIHPISFRESLIRETGLFQYQVNNPLQLADELRTNRWNTLCNYLTHYHELQPVTKLRVINLLSSLCFHEAVLDYLPKISSSEIASCPTLAKLALRRAMSNLMLQSHNDTLDNLEELENIASHAPLGSVSRFDAALHLVAYYSKIFRNLEAAKFWRSVTTQELDNIKNLLDNFTYKLLTSTYYRAIVLVPLLQQDKEIVAREMDLCESLAESLIHECKDEIQQIAANENLMSVFESRTKEALWLRDVDLAEERARKLTQMEPLYSRYRLQLGEILIKQGKIEEAAQIYRSAARLGPPGTAIAWFMAGQCHEKLGEIDIACDCYLASVRMDSLAISAVERLNNLAPRLGDSALVNWSNMRLLQLQEQQKIIANQSRTSYIPEASSELKVEAEKALTRI
jgi:tetratricopeptide (TPR) repeat protein